MALQVWLPLNGDLTNNGLENVTMSGSGTFTADGKIGKCLSGGSTIGITSQTLANSKTWSVCFWGYVVSANVTSNWTAVIKLHDGGHSLRVEVCPKSYANGIYCYSTHNNAAYKITTASILDVSGGHYDKWMHFCITSDGTTIRVYRDGVLSGSCGYDGSGTVTGGFTLENNNKIKKNDFRVYSTCLSPKEVEILARGLVLHYPLSDPYIESTSNLITVQYQSAGTVSGWGGHTGQRTVVDASNFPIPCNTCNKIAITYSGSSGGGLGQAIQTVSCAPSSTYSYSCYIRTPDKLSPLNANILYRYEYKSDGTQVSEAGCWVSANTQELGDNWYRVWGTFTVSASAVSFRVHNFFYPNKTCDYYIGCWQLELKNHVTPYVFGSRSENVVYDVSGYNYHGTKNGSVTYSNDTARYSVSTEFSKSGFISIPSFNVDTSAFTLNFWVKMKTATSQHFVLGTFNSWTNNGIGVYRDANAEWYSCIIRSAGESTYKGFSLYPTTGSWYMLTLTYDGTHYKGYLNGILKQNVTYGSGGVVSNPVFMVGNSKFNSTPSSENEEAFVSDVRFYATCLDQEDITKLYNTSASLANNGTLMTYELVEN